MANKAIYFGVNANRIFISAQPCEKNQNKIPTNLCLKKAFPSMAVTKMAHTTLINMRFAHRHKNSAFLSLQICNHQGPSRTAHTYNSAHKINRT